VRKSISWIAGSAIVACLTAPAFADFQTGQKAYEEGRHREAFLEWEADADNGNPIAQFLIGNMYSSGEGVDQDFELANTYYEKAAEQGHVNSALQLATNLRLGQGAPINYHKAAKWLYMAAEAGHPIARFDLGEMFLYGDTRNSFYPEPYHASQWFLLAGLDGIALAQFKLSQLYFDGKGVDVDQVKGYAWLTKAHRIAVGTDSENKWSVQAMPMERIIPAKKKDEEDLSFAEVIKKLYAEKTEELSEEVRLEAEMILSSGADEKLR
jgi:hypothetical protein